MKTMKKIYSESMKDGMKTFIDLFNIILEQSEFNLNQYVCGNSLVIPDDTMEELQNTLKKLIDVAPDVFREIENPDKFFAIFEELEDYENNEKFIKWMEKNIHSYIKPFKEK